MAGNNVYIRVYKHGNLLLMNTRALYVDYFIKAIKHVLPCLDLFSDINTWDVGKSCSPNIPRVYVREQRHGKHVLLLE